MKTKINGRYLYNGKVVVCLGPQDVPGFSFFRMRDRVDTFFGARDKDIKFYCRN